MPKRLQVDPGLDTPTLTPAAEPVNFYYKPQIPAPALKPIIDLSPLSEAAAKIAHEQRQLQAEKDRQGGKTAVQQAQQELSQAEAGRTENQSAWAKAVAAGTVPEGASPWTRVGAMEAMGQDLMQKYGRELDSRMEDVSRAQDAAGNPVVPDAPEKIVAEVWGKYAKNPVFKDFYAGRVATDMKPKIDAGFQAEAAGVLGKNQAEFRYAKVTQEQASFFHDLVVKGEAWTPQTYEKIRAFQTEQMHKRSMKEIHKSTLEAVKTVAAQEAEIDPNSAAEFLDHAMGIPSGTTTLGADVRTGTDLIDLKRQYLRDGEEKDARARRANVNKREDTLRTAVDEGMNLMSKAIAEGKNPIDAGNAEIARIRSTNAYGDLTGTVADAISEIVKGKSENSRPGLVSGLQQRVELGDTEGLATDMQGLLQTGALSWKDYAVLRDTLARREDVTAVVEENPVHLRGLQSIAALVPQDLPVEVRAGIQNATEEDSLRFTSEMVAYAQTLKGTNAEKAPELRKWAAAWVADVTRTRRAEAGALKAARDASIQTIETLMARHEDPTGALQEATKGGLLTRQEAGMYRAGAAQLAGGEWFMRSQEYADARDVIDGVVQEKIQELGKLSEIPGQYRNMLGLAREHLRSRYAARLSVDLKNVPIDQIPGASATILSEVVDEVTKSVGDEARARIKSFVASGESLGAAVEKAGEAPKAEASKLSTFEAVQAAVSAAGSRSAYKGYLSLGRVQSVDPDVYADIDGLTLDSFFHARRPSVEQSVWAESKRIVEAGDKTAPDALHSMARHVVVPWRDAVKGELAVYPSNIQLAHDTGTLQLLGDQMWQEAWRVGVLNPDWVDGDSRGARTYDAASIKKVALPGSTLSKMADDYIARTNALKTLQAVKIPLDVTKIDPYLDPFVSSYADWDDLANNTAAVTALMGTLGLPTDAANRDKWLKAQRLAVARTNPDLEDPVGKK